MNAFSEIIELNLVTDTFVVFILLLEFGAKKYALTLSKLTGFSHRPTTIDKATAPHRYLHIAMPFGKHIGNRCRCYCQSSSCSSNFARICQLKIISITPFKNMSFQNNGSPLFQNIAKIMKNVVSEATFTIIKSWNMLYDTHLQISSRIY